MGVFQIHKAKQVCFWCVAPNAHTSAPNMRLRNAACAYLQVWKTPRMESSEDDKGVQTEQAFQGSVLTIAGASTHFANAQERHFQVPPEKREGMSDSTSFVTFWTGLVTDNSLPLPLCLFAVVMVLSCPSSCDAERAISVLNQIANSLRNRMRELAECI